MNTGTVENFRYPLLSIRGVLVFFSVRCYALLKTCFLTISLEGIYATNVHVPSSTVLCSCCVLMMGAGIDDWEMGTRALLCGRELTWGLSVVRDSSRRYKRGGEVGEGGKKKRRGK